MFVSWRTWPIGFCILAAVSASVFVCLLASVFSPAETGDGRLGQAVGIFLLTAVLWGMLGLLLLAGGLMGRMPRPAAIAAVILLPVSGVAACVAEDAYSRNITGAIFFVVLLPLLIAFYAAWARFPRYHERFPPKATSLNTGIALGLVTAGAFLTGLN
jgi:hypothetical protein